jgi:hypothetical protein
MAFRKTSRAAYDAIRANGTLSLARWQVYDLLFFRGPMTGSEVDAALMKPGAARGHRHKRLSELERLGLAARVGERPCTVTGNRAELWDVTDFVPASAPPAAPEPALDNAELMLALHALLAVMRTYPVPGGSTPAAQVALGKLIRRLEERAVDGKGV